MSSAAWERSLRGPDIVPERNRSISPQKRDMLPTEPKPSALRLQNEAEIASLTKQNADLSRQIQELTAREAVAVAEANRQQGLAEEALKKIQASEIELNKSTSSLKQQEVARVALEQAKAECEKQLAMTGQSVSKLAGIREQLAILTTAKQTSDAQLAECTSARSAIEEQMRQIVNTTQSRINDLARQLATSSEQLRSETEENARLVSEGMKMASEIDECNKKHDETNNSASQAVAIAQAEASEAERKKDAAMAETERTKASAASQIAEAQALAAQAVQDAQDELKRTREQRESELENATRELESQKAFVATQVAQLQADVDACNEKNITTEADKARLEGELVEVRASIKKIEDLESTVARLTNDLGECNTRSSTCDANLARVSAEIASQQATLRAEQEKARLAVQTAQEKAATAIATAQAQAKAEGESAQQQATEIIANVKAQLAAAEISARQLAEQNAATLREADERVRAAEIAAQQQAQEQIVAADEKARLAIKALQDQAQLDREALERAQREATEYAARQATAIDEERKRAEEALRVAQEQLSARMNEQQNALDEAIRERDAQKQLLSEKLPVLEEAVANYNKCESEKTATAQQKASIEEQLRNTSIEIARLKTLEQSVNSLQSQLETCNSQNADCEARIKQQVADQESAIAAIRRAADEQLAANLASVEEAKRGATAEIERVRNETAAELERQRQETVKAQSDMAEQLATAKREAEDALLQARAVLEAELASTKASLEEQRQANQTAISEIERLRGETEMALANRSGELNTIISSKEAELEATRQRLTEQEALLAQKLSELKLETEKYNECVTNNTATSAEKERIQGLLAEAKTEVEKLQVLEGTLASLQSELETCTRERTACEARASQQAQEHQTALAALNADVQSKGARITELEELLSNSTASVERLIVENNSNKERIAELESALAKATTEIELLTKKLNELMKPKPVIDHSRPVNFFDKAFSEIRNTTPEYENAIEQRLANLPKNQQKQEELNYARSRPVGGRKKKRVAKKQ
jgi:chromosome segregation ATPase